jgi:hypothetical protein
MNQPIKVVYEDAIKLVSNIQSANEHFNTSIKGDFAPQNQLEFVKIINELNQMLERVREEYKHILIQNNQSAIQAVESFKETDQSISESFLLKFGE